MTVAILYVPVIHQGYLNLIHRLEDQLVERFYLLGDKLIDELKFEALEIRAIRPAEVRRLIQELVNPSTQVLVMNPSFMPTFESGEDIITVDEAMMHRLITKYYPDTPVTYESYFLRWDEVNVTTSEPAGYSRVSKDSFDQQIMAIAAAEADKSGDWWRRIGAVLVHGFQIMTTSHNRHLPGDSSPYAIGDPRDFVPAGTDPEISTALHAEQSVMMASARVGHQTNGNWLYVTTFPCPMCAKLVAASGIEKVFFRGGHVSLASQPILEAAGVELVLVPNLNE